MSSLAMESQFQNNLKGTNLQNDFDSSPICKIAEYDVSRFGKINLYNCEMNVTCKGGLIWGGKSVSPKVHPSTVGKRLENSDNVVGISGSRTGTGRSSFIVCKSSLYSSLSYVRSKQCTYSARPRGGVTGPENGAVVRR